VREREVGREGSTVVLEREREIERERESE